MSFRALIAALLCASSMLLAFSESASGSDLLEKVIRRKTLRIAADSRSMPWFSQNPRTGDWKGFEYDFAVVLARMIHPDIEVDIIGGDWDKLRLDVLNGRADILMNGTFLPAEEERGKNEIWSKCYYETGLGILYHAERENAPTLGDLKKGSVFLFHDVHATKIMQELGLKKYSLSPEDEKIATRIAEKSVDFFIYDLPAVRYYAFQNQKNLKAITLPLSTSKGCYAIMGAQGSENLITALNRAIDKLQPLKADILARYGL